MGRRGGFVTVVYRETDDVSGDTEIEVDIESGRGYISINRDDGQYVSIYLKRPGELAKAILKELW